MSLSPWPARTAAVSFAEAILVLGEALGEDNDHVTARLGATAAALVQRFAPDAPQAIKDEAVIRTAGWLRQAPTYGVRSETEGEIRAAFSPAMTGPLRTSGAMSLLSPWKVRRAGAIG